MNKKSYECEIVSHNFLLPDVCDITVYAPDIAQNAVPGQFIHVDCGGKTTLRRPFAICDAENGKVRFVAVIKGSGTQQLASKKPGDTLNILGALGRGYNVIQTEGKPVIVGGGAGTFPLYFLAKKMANKPVVILGFRSKDLIVMQQEFESISELHIATDDGSYGFHGFVTDCMLSLNLSIGAIYACGAIPMLRAVKTAAEKLNVKNVQVSLEQRMGCGIGACSVCVCETKYGYSKVCAAGPVYKAEEVKF